MKEADFEVLTLLKRQVFSSKGKKSSFKSYFGSVVTTVRGGENQSKRTTEDKYPNTHSPRHNRVLQTKKKY